MQIQVGRLGHGWQVQECVVLRAFALDAPLRAFGCAAEIQNHNLTIFLGRYNQVGGVCRERSCRRLVRSQQTCRIDKLRRALGPGCKEPGGRLCRKVYDKMPGQSVTKPMNKRFGPLLYEGGERRLNVAVTRARKRMTLVSSFDHHDMDPDRSKARGVELLRLYLEYAASRGKLIGDAGETPRLMK